MGNASGTDRYGNELSGFESNMKIVSAIPITKAVGFVTTTTERVIFSEANKGVNVVYQGMDKAGVVRYVGITERVAAIRFTEHANSATTKAFLQFRVIDGATGLTRIEARVWEQSLINQYGLEKNGGLLMNKINSITPKNWWKYNL